MGEPVTSVTDGTLAAFECAANAERIGGSQVQGLGMAVLSTAD